MDQAAVCSASALAPNLRTGPHAAGAHLPASLRTAPGGARASAPDLRTGPFQPSMWDLADEAGLAPLAGTVVRHHLGRGAWVDHLPGWVTGSEAVLDVLLGDIGWREDRRRMYERDVAVPRLLRWYGGDEPLPHPLLSEARAELNRYYGPELGEPFVTAGMCLYRDGKDSVAWHGDRIGRGRSTDTMVAILSFGSPRPLLLRPVGGGRSLRFPLGHGDLAVMGGSCQRTWEHCIPKTSTTVGPRVSVQFRPRGVA